MPIEPAPCQWQLPDPEDAGPGDVAGVGADLDPETLLAAYRSGLFPMHLEGELAWWAPIDRAVLPLERLRVTRSLRRSQRDFEIRVDTAFEEVVAACGEDGREGGNWINGEITEAFTRLHRMGWAHSVETWHNDELVGGLYGVAIQGFFAGESMFHRRSDASKVALMGLVEILRGPPEASRPRLLDVQWMTPHLESMGAVVVGRAAYGELLRQALSLPLPAPFDDGRR